ncbi:chemotaxis protein CheB [Motilimonas eburnea]|uniref:chemotaxis protein CheB n=1 Tax=Motilimonas eburnea TaxID=1737488 RepID=UPI001E3D9F34|nr:chemotaxis protein CheB [Motilimonas eburnea]MCE2573325.1 chemotaxis protein CheB [Motilimonas eburnea]
MNAFIEKKATYKALVVGVSAGGLKALCSILPKLPVGFPVSVIVVQHRKHMAGDYLIEYLAKRCQLAVQLALPSQPITPGSIYIAPTGYHLLVERNATFSLSIDARVNYSIPAIDVLFESAAICYQHQLIGLILTGANHDGSLGLKTVKKYHGLTLVQSPDSAEYPEMPDAAIAATQVDHILPLSQIASFLTRLLMGDDHG